MFAKIKTNFIDMISSKSKLRTFLLLFVFVATFFILGDSAFADEDQALKTFQGLLAFVAGAVGALTGLVMIFLDPSIISGQPVGLNGYLHNIWIFVSNIVYLIFAGLIIVAALANIVGKEGNMFNLKSFFPRFVVGILIVPFSWYIVQFIISLSSVFAVQVFTWPINTVMGTEQSSGSGWLNDFEIEWCENRIIDFQGNLSSGNNSGGGNVEGKFIYCKEGDHPPKKKLKEIMLGKNSSIGSIMYLYTYHIFEVDKFDKLESSAIGALSDLLKLSVHSLLNLLFFIVYAILLFAIFVVLLVRIVMIWTYTAISPVFGLNHFLSNSSNKIGKFGEFTLWEFARMAFLPVLISGALSFGFMFMLVIGNTYNQQPGSNSSNSSQNQDEIPIEFSSNLKLTLKGISIGDNQKGNEDEKLIKKLVGAKNIAGYFIMKLMGLAFLWIVVIAALNSTKITKDIAKPFEDFGMNVFRAAKQLPLLMPIPGTGGISSDGKPLTTADLKNASRIVQSGFSNIGGETQRSRQLGNSLSKFFPGGGGNRDLDAAVNAWKAGNNATITEDLKSHFNGMNGEQFKKFLGDNELNSTDKINKVLEDLAGQGVYFGKDGSGNFKNIDAIASEFNNDTFTGTSTNFDGEKLSDDGLSEIKRKYTFTYSDDELKDIFKEKIKKKT